MKSKYNINQSVKTLMLMLFAVWGLQNQALQAQTGCTLVDTVCTTGTTDFFVNDDGTSTYTWTTNNGATLTIPAGDTLVMVDWSTSTVSNGLDSVCVSSDGVCLTCRVSYIEECAAPCIEPDIPLTLKRVGAPTICEILAANPADPIGALDCDGGGVDNLTECQNGSNPENASDDDCIAEPFYYIGFDNHGLEDQQISGNPISGTFPIGMVTFQDCMMPQPTPATITLTGQPFCMGGIKDANMITSSNWSVSSGACGTPLVTQRDADNPTICEVIIDMGLPTEQVFSTSQAVVGTGASLTAAFIKDALELTNILPACMIASGGAVAGISDNEANCVDYVGANWQYTIDCECTLSNGDRANSVTVKVCQDSGDYANYLLKLL